MSLCLILYRFIINRWEKSIIEYFFYIIDMILINAWLLYKSHANELGTPKQKQLCLFEFRHSVANALTLEKKTGMAVKRGISLWWKRNVEMQLKN